MLLDRLIKKKETGNSSQLASKLGISRSHLFNHIDELKDLGVDIQYNKSKLSYEYYGDYELEIRKPIQVNRKKKDIRDTNGGSFCKNSGLLSLVTFCFAE